MSMVRKKGFNGVDVKRAGQVERNLGKNNGEGLFSLCERDKKRD